MKSTNLLKNVLVRLRTSSLGSSNGVFCAQNKSYSLSTLRRRKDFLLVSPQGKRFDSTQASSDNRQNEEVVEKEDEHTIQQAKQDAELMKLLQEIVPLPKTDDIREMLKGCKSAKEVRHVLETVVYRHHMCNDPLNGHGFRVAILQALTMVAPRTQAMKEWFDCVGRFRKLGFVLTRTFTAEGFTTIKQWLTYTFDTEGRTPFLVTEGTAYIRQLLYWCHEDSLIFDHVLYTRIVFLLTMIVSYFDRQNLYRSSFSADFVKRDGIVVEWVQSNERCIDYDECVLQCDALMEEVLEFLRNDIPSRPNFSIIYRLIDYYFATDNVEKMIAVMEDATDYNVNIAESSTAKLMQLACAFNYPNVPELFMRWRVSLPQCTIASPDISRLLFYYSKSGGGAPCPACGEPYNHRNVNVYHWMHTPPHQRKCPVLAMAQLQKGELEENNRLPQNADNSEKAFQLLELSVARSIEWGPVEWRGFLLCCMFSPRALEAKAILERTLNPVRMDDFLRATYMRLLRHHAPQEAMPALQGWQQLNIRISPIALQEGLMSAVTVADSTERAKALQFFWNILLEKDSYVMPLTRRYFERRLKELKEQRELGEEEEALIKEVIESRPRHVSLLDMKDSASDFVIGTSKKNIYIPKEALAKVNLRRSH